MVAVKHIPFLVAYVTGTADLIQIVLYVIVAVKHIPLVVDLCGWQC